MQKKKVLFVCLGNICRSPLAEGLFKQKVIEAGLTEYIEVDSCGTSNFHIGEQPDPRTVENALSNGLRLDHQARQFNKTDFEHFDFIIAMDSSNYNHIVDMASSSKERMKVSKMRDFDELDKGSNVPDPYFGGKKGFQDVYDILDRSTAALLQHIRQVQ
jgi:protein-tyrosine phosphatase